MGKYAVTERCVGKSTVTSRWAAKLATIGGLSRRDRQRREKLPQLRKPRGVTENVEKTYRRQVGQADVAEKNLPLPDGCACVTTKHGRVCMGWLPCACDQVVCGECLRVAKEHGHDGWLLQPSAKVMENVDTSSWASAFDQRQEQLLEHGACSP